MRAVPVLLMCSCVAIALGCARSHRRADDAALPGRDAGRDAGVAEDAFAPVDAYVRPDAAPCVPEPERCDDRDDDCDGLVDEEALCSIDRGIGACVAGACAIATCDDGFADCDGDIANGCEAEVANDRRVCGACGVECRLTEACVAGVCEREDVLDITAGLGSCALLASGRVLCWGWNFAGEVGDGTLAEAHAPTEVLGVSNAASISSDGGTTCTLDRGGVVQCWGEGHYGQRGDGTFELAGPEARVVTGLPPAAAVTVGSQSVCALTRSAEVWCWGRSIGLGRDGNESVSRPLRVEGLPPIRRLFESETTFAESEDGRV